jgi:hypothetical protein
MKITALVFLTDKLKKGKVLRYQWNITASSPGATK